MLPLMAILCRCLRRVGLGGAFGAMRTMDTEPLVWHRNLFACGCSMCGQLGWRGGLSLTRLVIRVVGARRT